MNVPWILQICCIIILYTHNLCGQTNPNFNVNLQVDYASAEQAIALFEDRPVNTRALSELRGSRIVASTTGYIADRGSVSHRLQYYLDSLKYHQIITDDVFHLEVARKNVATIKNLLDEVKKRNFNRRVIATVEQIFPQQATISVTIPVYVVAFGHENVDAFVRRIIWHGDEPQFVSENEGELTIVINLGQSINYGNTLDDRFVSLLGVVAHEVFHAAFGAYKETSPSWKQFNQNSHRAFDVLLDISQNEGIAYYLSLDQHGGGYVPRDWTVRTREVFSLFNKNARELLSEHTKSRRVQELLRTANLSGYWESYGAMTGMFIAREIDIRLGRAALIETLERTPFDFFRKYIALTEEDSNLPKFSPDIVSTLGAN